MRWVIAAAVIVVSTAVQAGSAFALETITGPSGKLMHISKCSQSPTGCYQEASKACSGPYQVLDSYSKAGGLFADLMPGPVTWYYMTYQCGATNGQVASFPMRGQQYNPPQPQAPANVSCNQIGQFVNCRTY